MNDFVQWWQSLEVPGLETVLNLFGDIWNLRLFHQGDTEVHVNQVVLAVVFVVVGAIFCKRLSKVFTSRMGSLMRMNLTSRVMLNRLVYYLMLFGLVVMGLSIAGIPITVFTLFGGAIAIGVGFGAQNACNNLISGFLLMIERTVRVGDIIEVGGFEARVEDIGNRCVRVRRTDGADVLVPNSTLLENMVVNWTLFDNQIRTSVKVGIAYGSDTQRMRDLLYEVANAHEKILRNPGPTVLFTEFGDNSLNFEVMFWAVITRPMDLRMIESDLRFSIDKACNEAGIIIAFPQRDVHLDATNPIPVQLLDNRGEAPDKGGL
jgi:small-conductance mechanosensitive channel